MKQPYETLLVEIRTEELPPKQVWQLADNFPNQLLLALQQRGFTTTDTKRRLGDDKNPLLLATPRRFAALIDQVLSVGVDSDYYRKGPKVEASFDKSNNPTKALLGFMKSVGVSSVDELVETTDKGQRHFAYQTTLVGRPLCDEIVEIVEKTVLAQNAPRKMRWGDYTFKFIRPIRGVVIQHGDTPLVGKKMLNVISSSETVGHPILCTNTDKTIKFSHANNYVECLQSLGNVIVDMQSRQKTIEAQRNKTNDGYDDLINEVTAMTESPKVYIGQFDKQFLSLPAFCIEGCMVRHQRAFPMLDKAGQQSANYQLVADNHPTDPQQMIEGFNKVLRARLQDVAFYIEQDKKLLPDDCLQALGSIVYHNRLGTQLERVLRLQKMMEVMATMTNMTPEDINTAQQVMRLCKADLSTQLIDEYPEFEGWVAAHYFCSDNQALAPMVRYHHTHNLADIEALSVLGQLIVLVNHLEKLIALFGIGEKPSGSKDPYGCRISAGVVASIYSLLGATQPTLIQQLPLNQLIESMAEVFPPLPEFSCDEIWQFIVERTKSELLEKNPTAKSEINAVFALPQPYIYDAKRKTSAVIDFLHNNESAADLIVINKRIGNILNKSSAEAIGDVIDESLLQDGAEKELYDAILKANTIGQNAMAEKDYETVLTHTVIIKPTIDAFFESVFVNDDNLMIRKNRLALLRQLHQFLLSVADLSQLS